MIIARTIPKEDLKGTQSGLPYTTPLTVYNLKKSHTEKKLVTEHAQ